MQHLHPEASQHSVAQNLGKADALMGHETLGMHASARCESRFVPPLPVWQTTARQGSTVLADTAPPVAPNQWSCMLRLELHQGHLDSADDSL